MLTITYLGKNGKRAHQILVEGETYTVKKAPAGARPGLRYEVEGEKKEGGGYVWFPGTARLLGPAENAAEIALAAKAAEAVIVAEKLGERARSWREGLAPAREAYRNARGSQRAVIPALIVAEVTK